MDSLFSRFKRPEANSIVLSGHRNNRLEKRSHGASFLLLAKAISHPTEGFDRIPKRAQFFPQTANVGIDGPCITFVRVPPNLVEEPFAGLNASLVGGQFDE